MKFKKIFLVGLLCLGLNYLPLQSFAWGMTGHRVVGEIADHYLKAKTRKAIKRILGYESLAMSANWGDFIKSDSAFNHLYNWHFVNLPAGLDYNGVSAVLDAEQEPNVYNKILAMSALLKEGNASLTEKQLALRMLVHMIGDLHQPMHTARKDDLGGNRVSVLWFNQKSNLHRVWDDQLISSQDLSFSEYTKAINFVEKDQLRAWQNTSLKQVVFESYTICNAIYAQTPANGNLSYRYIYDWLGIANQQMLKGGVRLAQTLNDIFA